MKTLIAKSLLKTLCAGAVCLVAPQLLQAQSYYAAYPSDSSTVVGSVGIIATGEYGYFWSAARGDSITQAFTGTGLSSVDKMTLEFPITQTFLTAGNEVDWAVDVNGTQVGTWDWTAADGIGSFSATYNFPSIAGSGDYTIAMDIINETPAGDGSIAIGAGQLSLTNGVTRGVPDAGSTGALLSFTVCGIFGLYRKIQK